MQRSTYLASALVVGALTLSGCGSSSLDNGSSSKKVDTGSGTDKSAAALVPSAIKSKGTLTVGSDASYAPSEFVAADGKTIQGFDVDLFTAVAKKLGLKVTFQNAGFDSIIPGVVKSGKYDVGVSSFTINADRLKVAQMVSYFNAGTQWATVKGDPKKVNTDKPCGLKVAVQTNTVQDTDDLPAKVKACAAAGKPIKVDRYDKQDEATAAVASGKDDAMLADSPVVAYAVKQSKGKLESVGSIYDAAPYGYVLPPKDSALGKAVVAALEALKSDGTYTKILKAWGVDQGALTSFEINPTS
ncbi:MAG: transporter substrate-binding protein [Marmoricola sp.]|nr:transporter substrate-binding protein [Marmoricola sp.]